MVYAIDLTDPTINPIAHISTIGSIITILFPIVYIGASLTFLGMLIMAGFIYLQSEGDPEKLKKAQQLLVSSVIGLAIILVSYLLVKLITNILGYQLPI